MAGETKKTSELGIVTTLANTDRVVVLTNPASSAQTQTITANNLVNSLRYANTTAAGVVKVGQNLTINATGHISSFYPAYANTSTAGIIKVGTNLTVNATGYLNAGANGAANTGSWTFDGTRANTGGIQNSFIDGQSPGGLLLYNDYEITLLANNAYFEFNQDGTLSLSSNGDIKIDGVSVLGTGQIDGGNAFTAPTAEITVDGGGA